MSSPPPWAAATARVIREHRASLALSRVQLARKAKCCESAVVDLEQPRASTSARLHVLAPIAAALGMSAWELVEEIERDLAGY